VTSDFHEIGRDRHPDWEEFELEQIEIIGISEEQLVAYKQLGAKTLFELSGINSEPDDWWFNYRQGWNLYSRSVCITIDGVRICMTVGGQKSRFWADRGQVERIRNREELEEWLRRGPLRPSSI